MIDLRELADPAHTALLVMEMQRGVVGEPGDLESRRYHGFTPFTGTSLDQTLRSLGVRTVVAVGVSLNLAIPGLCLEAVNLGYRVVVLTDAVAGMPAEYGDAVMANTIS